MLEHLVVLEILQQVFHFHVARKSVVFCWVPGHTDLPGKAAAKASALLGNLHETEP
jgi:hypothetical protein